MRSFGVGLLVILVLGWTMTAEAQVCTAKMAETILVRPGRSREFYSLVDKKLYAEATRCCVACVVAAGTKLIVVDGGLASPGHTGHGLTVGAVAEGSALLKALLHIISNDVAGRARVAEGSESAP